MKDLDFDELDKAVNSLMAGVPKTPSAPSETPENTVEIPSTISDSAPPAPKIPVSPPAPARSSSLPVPATRRGGRFMDVVHPSSAMKKPESPRVVSRQGVTLEPTSPNPIEEVPSAPTLPDPVTISSTSGDTKVPEKSATQENEWPDPLDMANFGKEDEKQEQKPETKPSEPKRELDELTVEAPLVSPFLPDTKVEKRPLGANVTETPDAKEEDKDTTEGAVSLPATENDDQLPATAEDVKPLLPEEFHSELVAIESDTTNSDADKESAAESEKTDTPWVAPQEESKSEEPSVPESKPQEKKPAAPVGSPSIPQQYREEPSTGDQKNGAIYDTDNYHQPLAHPAKQKSGWMWIVWILVILLVGAGGGAAAYFLGLV